MNMSITKSTSSPLHVYTRDKKKTFFKGDAFSLTSVNDKGVFDVLPEHANFISLIKDYVIVDKGKPQEIKIMISSGVLKVARNQVDIFLDV